MSCALFLRYAQAVTPGLEPVCKILGVGELLYSTELLMCQWFTLMSRSGYQALQNAEICESVNGSVIKQSLPGVKPYLMGLLL